MVPLSSLWLPILVAAVLVFIVSSIIHMALGYHAGDWRRLGDEDGVQEALRRFNIPPGDYMLPKPVSAASMKDPAFLARREKGPVFIMTMFPSGVGFGMGKQLASWFLYAVVVGLFAGYVAAVVLPAGAPYMTVFRITGTVAFAGYALALMQNSIWYLRGWGQTLLTMFDGLIYALLTAGAFGWLWP